MDSQLRVLIVAAECAPLATAGDLADLVAATSADAAELGHEVVVVIPHHREAAFGRSAGVRIDRLTGSAWGAPLEARVVQGALEVSGTPILSVDAPAWFDRDAIYGAADDGERYIAFCTLVAALIDETGFAPDIVVAQKFRFRTLDVLPAGGPSWPMVMYVNPFRCAASTCRSS